MTKQVLLAKSCNVAYAMSIVGGKWKIAIIWKLMGHELRFAELRRQLSGISEGVLITQLKELERDGIITRTSYNQVPPRVEYSLTPKGEELETALQALDQWGSIRE